MEMRESMRRKKMDRKKAGWAERERAIFGLINRILDHVGSKDEPISEERIEAFLRNPEVIIPENVVEFRTLPAKYEANLTIILLNSGKLAYRTVNEDGFTIFEIDNEKELRRLRNMPKNGLKDISYLVGEYQDDLLWVRDYVCTPGPTTYDKWDDQGPAQIMLGGSQIANPFGLKSVLIMRDGRIIICYSDKARPGKYILAKLKDEKTETVYSLGEHCIGKFIELPSGQIWGITANDFYSGKDFFNPTAILIEDHQFTAIKTGARILDVMEEKNVPVFVASFSEDSRQPFLATAQQLENADSSQNKPLNRLAYSHGITKAGRSYAYIANGRHDQKRWVINGELQSAMDWVSELFEHPDHGLCYYGRIGNKLLTLKWPA